MSKMPHPGKDHCHAMLVRGGNHLLVAHGAARLDDGARIGIVSPAYWLDDERLERAIRVFEDAGFEIIPGASTRLRKDIFAGSPEARAADIIAMFADPSIEAIICARGGYGGNRVLPLLDYEVIRANPKIFVGYSDVTGYLTSIGQRAGLGRAHRMPVG